LRQSLISYACKSVKAHLGSGIHEDFPQMSLYHGFKLTKMCLVEVTTHTSVSPCAAPDWTKKWIDCLAAVNGKVFAKYWLVYNVEMTH